ncbi:MAG: hypothetical protein HUU11_03105 [Anaerolineales bacterium]|nr:hypothetical protein [Anaerolineales bacterium]
MHCPRCKHPDFVSSGTCPKCGFHGDPDQIEELSRLEWLLREMETWVGQGILKQTPKRLQKHYTTRRHELLTDLGLSYLPFTLREAEQAWREFRQYERLFAEIETWLAKGYVKTGFLPDYHARSILLRGRLADYQGAQFPQTDQERLDEINFLLEAIRQLERRNEFTSRDARRNVTTPLLAEKAELEKILASPPEIKKEVKPKAVPAQAQAADLPVTTPKPAEPPAPRPPLREWLWRSILSERTLQALLFLGIFLLFVAGISFVVWGWEDFSAPVRVAIPFGFTALFFGLGWIVRTRTRLYRSAIALSAIAALLIPIDSYTIYANYGSPPEGLPEFWLITSLACLIAYILAALLIQSRFFGYITGAAAGSTILSLLEVFTDVSRDWYSAALSVLAVGMILLGTRLSRLPRPGRWRVFSEPFRYLALWIPAALMPLSLGLRLVTRDAYDSLHYAMSVNWLLGGFIFAWGAIHHRSRGLGILSALSLPVSVYMAQGALFYHTGINPAWHAFGLACLTPLYLYAGHRLLSNKEDPVLSSHGQTATRWGIVLIVASALLSLTDLRNGTSAAASHAILIGSAALFALLWKRPRSLYAASFFSFTASTFAMTELNLSLNQLGVGWASLAILHVLFVLRLARRPEHVENRKPFLIPLIVSAYTIAALAILPPIFTYDGHLLAYALGNWIVLSAWGAHLAHRGQPGFVPILPTETGKLSFFKRLLNTGAIYHWFTTLPLPFWVWIVAENNEFPDHVLPLLLVALAWIMVFVSYWLKFTNKACRLPWRLTGLAVSVAAPIVAFINAPDGYTPAITLLAIGILYFADTLASRASAEFYPAGLVTAWGLWLILDRARVDREVITFALCLLVAVYILAGLEAERRKIPIATYKFLAPLYQTAHIIFIVILFRIYIRPLEEFAGGPEWSNAMQLWGAADQLLLALVYVVFAWGRYQERWGHVAAWLGMIGGGFIAIVYSRGHGSLAAKGALIAAAMVLAERGLNYLKQRDTLRRRIRAFFRLAWRLYQRPLLVAGWIASVGIIILALVRNLILLGGGRIQQTWAAIGLLIITALYALSARMFHKARFVWFSVIVVFAPWTILTNLGWFTTFEPTLPDFAVSWTVLGWLLFLIGLWVARRAPRAYMIPLKTATHVLLPFSMFWAIANTEASLFTVGLSIALYVLSAWFDHNRSKQSGVKVSILGATKFFYPALGLIPLWAVYWLDYLFPSARHEHFGLMLLAFGALGLASGLWLEHIAPRPARPEPVEGSLRRAYGLPAYLTGYVSIIVGTMLVAHLSNTLAWALLYDAVLMVASAVIFRNSLWLYPGTALAALSLLIALNEAGVPAERQGWWLIGLAAVYLLTAWVLRRVRLNSYASVLIVAGFALTALGLPPSSLDQTGAIWGYGSAALLYAISAFWLRQPLLLTPASALIVIPYASLIQRSTIPSEYYGLSLFPGALMALALGWALDRRLGAWTGFPWSKPGAWFAEFAKRLFQWWAFPLYVLGLGLATAAPFFADAREDLIALNLILLASFHGWAVYRFKLRFWLLTALLSAHYALGFFLQHLGLWQNAEKAWLRFLPLTVILLVGGLVIERRLNEGSPLHTKRWFWGWSRPFYVFVFLDILLSQSGSLRGTFAGAEVSLVNLLMIAVLASAWRSPGLTYFSALLGLVALMQWRAAADWMGINLPVHLAGLALGYGVLGFGYSLLKRQAGSGEREAASDPKESWHSVWEVPLQRSAMILSIFSLGLGFVMGIDLAGWSVRALFGLSFRRIVDVETVYMAIWTLSLIGLLYAAASAVYRRMRLGYLAVGMLLTGWYLYAFYVNAWDNLRQLQWYALPAGLYLLGIGFLEWRRGNKTLARWLDYAAILLLLGSLFWQTLVFGWGFALMLGGEGFAAFWWGSARRLRRFFYTGMSGVILAALGQLLNALQEVNQWITFGLIGLILVVAAIIVERKLEAIKAWQQVLETWE